MPTIVIAAQNAHAPFSLANEVEWLRNFSWGYSVRNPQERQDHGENVCDMDNYPNGTHLRVGITAPPPQTVLFNHCLKNFIGLLFIILTTGRLLYSNESFQYGFNPY